MSKHFRDELEKLNKKVLVLSALVEENFERAVRSISERNVDLAKDAREKDQIIDQHEVDVEEECLKILALHQPVAIDLRFVIAILKINNDLERIGDLAVNIAERSMTLNQEAPIEMPFDFETMEQKTRHMVKMALKSLIELDLELADKVCSADDEVDEIHRQMYARVTKEIKEKPEFATQYINCLSISRLLERAADYATNIAEDVIYMIEGKIVRHHLDKQ